MGHKREGGRHIVAGFSVAAFLLSALPQALSHSFYPYECCSALDCYPVKIPPDEIERRPEGWLIKPDGVLIPFGSARPSPDHHFHICRRDAGKGALIQLEGLQPCFWAPTGEG